MRALELLQKLISFKSITPSDDGALDFIAEYLSDFQAIRVDKEGVKNLFLYKDFGSGSTHLCLAGHIDVVPPGSGWDSDPFTPTIKDGKIYGRGTQDMKGGLAAQITALKNIKEFDGRLSLLVTSDEEGDAYYGTIEALKYLKEKEMLPDFAIIAEPTCEYVSGDTIKVGRRGSINGIIEIDGVQGHAAYPERAKNPIEMVAPILYKVAGVLLDSGDEYFSPSRLVITDIRAGMEVTNVTPSKLKLMFNVRNSTKTSMDDVKNFIDTMFAGVEHNLTLKQTAKPFVTNRESKVVKVVKSVVERCVGMQTKLSTSGGTSNARFFEEFGVDTVEFGTLNNKIHALNESVALSEIEALKEVYLKVLQSF